MDQLWQIEMFGWLRAVSADRVVSRFRTHKSGVLLAYLAYYQNRSHPREQLIELLWPGCVPSAGRANLRGELPSLRRQLEPPGVPPGAVLVANRETVQLNPAACTTDVAAFETALAAAERTAIPAERAQHLLTAAGLYRGELLPGYFEEWILPERQRLAEAFLTALHGLVALLEELGDRSRALQWARRAVAADPLCEESHHLLIHLLVAAGQFDAARAQYEQGEQLLDRELGSTLSPEIHALVKNLPLPKDRPSFSSPGEPRQQHRDSAPEPRAAPAASGAETSPAASGAAGVTDAREPLGAADHPTHSLPLRFTRFFGREAEIAALVEVLSGIQHGGTETRRGITADIHRDAQDEEDMRQGYSPPHPVHPVHPCEFPSVSPCLRGEFDRSPPLVPRLITLTGPGGTGKTRLALEFAAQLRDAFPGGVWFVPLQELTDPALIPDQILLALRLPRSPERETLEQVVTFLSRAPALVLLDNFEHLVEGGAEIARHLLERAASLTVLVTSRQRLGLEGEREFPVGPLPVPGVQAFGRPGVQERVVSPPESLNARTPERLNALLRFPSVALFVDRAQAVRPDFQVTAHNAPAVAALCKRLEGLPLAIELAAARATVLTPQQMLAHLGRRFELLVSRQRPADVRHRSLWATLDWSYQLLAPDLQRFFARLSVFRGGWTLEAAAAVCGFRLPTDLEPIQNPKSKIQNAMALEFLEQLRDCSLVQAVEAGGEMRFHLLETLREFGAEQLEAEERTAVAHRHAFHYLALAERAEPELVRTDQVAWLDRLESEIDNLRTAQGWLEASGDAQAALRLGGALWRFWHVRGHHREGQEWLVRLLARDASSGRGDCGARVRRAKALNAAGMLAWYQGDYDTTRRLAEESLAIGRDLNDRRTILFSLTTMAFVAQGLGDSGMDQACCEESLAIARELGDPWLIADALNDLGEAAGYRGDIGAARPLLEESLRLFRELGDRQNIAVSLRDLAYLARASGDLAAARALLDESLALRRELRDQRGVAITLCSLGGVAADQGDFQAARALLGESLIVQRELGDRRGAAAALCQRAEVALREGDCKLARTLLTETLAISHELGNRAGAADALNGLALTAQYQGDYATARTLAEESLTIGQTAGTKWTIARSLDLLGFVAQQQGECPAARALYEESLALRREQNHRLGIARTLSHLGEAALLQGDLPAARSLLEEGLAIQREAGLRFEIPFVLSNQGLLALYGGDLAAAKARFEESLTLGREIDNHWAVAGSLNNLGLVASSQGDLEAAGSLLAESLAIRRRLGAQPGIAASLHALGDLLLRQGDLTAARSHYGESLSLRCAMGEKGAVAECLEGLATVAGRQGLPEPACRLFGAAAALRETGGWPLQVVYQSEYERQVAAVCDVLGGTAFAAAWAAGQAMTPEHAIAYAYE